MKTEDKYTCGFCGADVYSCENLIVNEGDTAICDRCVKAITAYLKSNPETKHLWYPPKPNNKEEEKHPC